MKKICCFLKRNMTSPAVLAAFCSAVLLTVVLMLHPLIGMADNGDFYRTINGQGIYKLDRYEEDQYFNYFSSKYGVYEYYNEWENSLFSSQNLYIKAALFLNKLFSPDTSIFDIRFLSVLLVIELVIGIYLLVDYIAWKKERLQGMLLAALCLFIFADTAYTAYFNSFYGEGIVFVSTLLLASSALLLTQRRYPPVLLVSSVLINGIILIFTKQQNATEGLPLCLLFIWMAFFFGKDKKSLKRTALLGAVAMAGCGIMMYVIIPEDFVRINQYHAMTRGALMVGENPEETLEEFGIDGQYSVLDGSIYYERYPAVDVESNQLIENFYAKYGFVSLTFHYLTHPGELVTMLNKAAANGYLIRPAMQGNYERDAGRMPGEQTALFTLYSEMKAKLVPNTAGFALIWILMVCGACLRDRHKLIILICIIIMGLIQIGTSIIGAGDADMSKHIFMYNVTFDIVSFVCFAPLLSSFILFIGHGMITFVRKRKKLIVSGAVFIFCIGYSQITVLAAQPKAEANTQLTGSRILMIGHKGEDLSVAERLAQAYGLQTSIVTEYDFQDSLLEADYIITTAAAPIKAAMDAGIPAVCIGEEFWDIAACDIVEYRNESIQFRVNGYTGNAVFMDETAIITSAQGNTVGTLLLADGKEYPFAAQAEDGNYYAPCFAGENVGAQILLGAVLQQLIGRKEAGNSYFMIDEVYAFSDLNKLCIWAEELHNNGIPFLVRIMPLYDNLEYPAFHRFMQVLLYMQNQGGTVIIHEPLIAEEQMEAEPLSEKMKRLELAMTEEGVHYRQMNTEPFLFTIQELNQITSDNRNFGRLPFDMTIGITPEASEEDFSVCLEQVNHKWMSFTDLQKDYMNTVYLYKPVVEQDEFIYRQQAEVAFADFFDASDRVLLIVVGVSLTVLVGFLVIGRRWYRRKFFR